MIRIRAHFDGRVIIPDQPVNLPVDEPLDVAITPCGENGDADGASSRENLRKLEEFFRRPPLGDIPLDNLRRENLYEDRA